MFTIFCLYSTYTLHKNTWYQNFNPCSWAPDYKHVSIDGAWFGCVSELCLWGLLSSAPAPPSLGLGNERFFRRQLWWKWSHPGVSIRKCFMNKFYLILKMATDQSLTNFSLPNAAAKTAGVCTYLSSLYYLP